ncbi:MAG: galactose mutarotase, partial [Muribaculaceae bacterium]|nr:galactose mutarotase [Muribaculaceae bacterium]
MTVSEKRYPSEKGNISLIRIENETGAYVVLSSFGAGVVEVGVPDRNGKIENVALRYADPKDYLYDGPHMGKIPGRYANRIAEGRINVDGKEYQLDVNLPPHHLHGGKEGFSNRNWETELFENGVRFTYFSPDGEENYPGGMKVTATYRWSEDNRLSLDLHAETDAETVVNLTNHTYWNLEGADAGTALHHEMRMKAHGWLPTDKTQIPSGEIAPVAGTPMDFTEWKEVGRDIKEDFEALKIGKGYDHCWVIDEWEPGKMIEDAIELRDNKSGRLLTISSDQPGVQVYTGNWLKGSPDNCSGRGYEDYDGIAIEMQGFPDAPNQPQFPTQTLCPGESYDRSILFSFSVI